MSSGFDESWKEQKDEDVWRREKACVDILNQYLKDELKLHPISMIRSKYDCEFRGCKIELEERKPNVILNDRYMFANDRGLSALDRKILECFDPARTLLIIYGYWDRELHGYVHTYEKFLRQGIRQNYGNRKDSYFVLLKDKAGSPMNAQKLAERVKFLCQSIQLKLPME
jgi:hypothetical protein